GVGGRPVVRDPSAKRVLLTAKLSGLGLFLWKLRFHLSINEHGCITPQLVRVDAPPHRKSRAVVSRGRIPPVDSEKPECYRRANLRGSPQKADPIEICKPC